MKEKKEFVVGGILFTGFIALLIMVLCVDVKAIGPEGSEIGLSWLNKNVFETIGTCETWHSITGILGDVVMFFPVLFAAIGVVQLIKRKSFKGVDLDLYYLAGFYVVMMASYFLFEKVIINYRPVLDDGKLEASFPSSHTLLAVCIMGTTIIQIGKRIKNKNAKVILQIFSVILMAVIVVGRLLAGVHWLTDILSGLLMGLTYVFIYAGLVKNISES